MELWVSWSILAGCILTFVGLGWLALRLKAANRWVRVLTRSASGLLSLPFAFSSLLLLYAQSCEKHTPLIGSPDKRHVARVMVSEGWNSADWATVIVRQSWNPFWKVASRGEGFYGNQYESIEPQVRWLDNSHLLIEYRRTDGDGYSACPSKVGSTLVYCRLE